MSRLTSDHSSSISLANSKATIGGKEATVLLGCRSSHAPSDTDSRPSRIRVKLRGLRQTGPLRKGKEPLANERAALANFGPATFVRSSVWTLEFCIPCLAFVMSSRSRVFLMDNGRSCALKTAEH